MTIKTRLERAEDRAGIRAAVHIIALCKEGTAASDDPQPYVGWAGDRAIHISAGQTHADFAQQLRNEARGGGVSFLDDDSQKL